MSIANLQESFTKWLPFVRRNAWRAFMHLDYNAREEAIANVISLCWKAYRRLAERGYDIQKGILKTIVMYSVRQTKSGRTINWAGKARDFHGRRNIGKAIQQPACLDDFIGRETGVVDTVSFRVDVPRFMATLPEKQQKMAAELAVGGTTTEVAERHGITPGAVSQFRSRFKNLFEEFFAS